MEGIKGQFGMIELVIMKVIEHENYHAVIYYWR